MRRLLGISSIVIFMATAAVAGTSDVDGARSAVSNGKCPDAAEKPVGTTSVVSNSWAAVGVRCDGAAWIAIERKTGSDWVKVNDTLNEIGSPIPLAIKGVPQATARGLWDRWRQWGSNQNAKPGSPADMAAVKRASLQRVPRLKILKTFVVGAWALTEWTEGEAGGEELWHQTNGAWSRVAGGGGAMDALLMSALGAPYSIAQKLMQAQTTGP